MSNKANFNTIMFIIGTCLLLLLNISCKVSRRQNESKQVFPNTSPHLVVKDSIINLGQHSQTEVDTIPFQFILTNENNSITAINNIDVSCGCISIQNKAKAIRSKESFILKGSVNVKKQTGHLSKAIFVNYGKGELLTLRVTADIN